MIDRKLSCEQTEKNTETTNTAPTQVGRLKSLNRNRIAALLVLASTTACGARSELPVDNNESTSGTGGSSSNETGGTGGSSGQGGAGGTGGSPDCNKIQIEFVGPEGLSIAKDSTNVPVFCWNIKNGCVEGSMKSATFETEGASDPTQTEFTITYPDGSRMTEFQNGSDTAFSHTFDGINFPLSADSVNELCLYANFTEQSVGNYGFRYVPRQEDFSNDAILDGVPESIAGSQFTVGGISTGMISINAANNPLPTATPGQNATIAEFTITEGAIDDGALQRMSLHLTGTCNPDNISNFKLFNGTTQICALDKISDYTNADVLKIAHLSCPSPYGIPKGATKNFHVTADQTCPPGTFIETSLAHPSDLFIMDETLGEGESVEGYDGSGGPGSYSSVDIQ